MDWNETTEAEMMRRASSGDQEACERLYHRHSSSVRSWCWRITRNVADAEDLTQEVFMRLFVKLPTFRHESTLRTWLYRVAVNCALMHLRQRKRAAISLPGIFELETAMSVGKLKLQNSTPTSASERLMISQAVDTLPFGKRSVFIMHDISGFSHKEIAECLSLSIENSKCRLRRARLELRSALS